MPQLDFVDTPPLNIVWRPTTPSRSCLCPVTADVVSTDEIGSNWVSVIHTVKNTIEMSVPHYVDQGLANGALMKQGMLEYTQHFYLL